MNSQKGSLAVLVLALIAATTIVAFSIFKLGFNQTKDAPLNSTNTQIAETQKQCAKNGYGQKTDFLTTYTVKYGDTLLSLATTELGNPSRVNELIELNKDKYPSLSLENPFLEQGWELFLPPNYTTSTSGDLAQVNGRLSKIRNADGALEINYQTAHFATLILTKDTQTPKNYTFKVDDCITAVTDNKTGKVYSILLQ